jgi:hypothetical protein
MNTGAIEKIAEYAITAASRIALSAKKAEKVPRKTARVFSGNVLVTLGPWPEAGGSSVRPDSTDLLNCVLPFQAST